MKIYLIKYDNLFKTSFPYSMGWHSKYYISSSDMKDAKMSNYIYKVPQYTPKTFL